MPHSDTPWPDADPAPSKTQRKKDMHALQELGEALLKLPEDRLAPVPMPESLRDALREARRVRSHEGRRRHLQYIGKLMRTADEGVLREAVAAFELGSARQTLDLHRAEAWRQRLLTEDEALTAWMREFPGSDLQRLRTLIRQARKDAADAPEQRSGRAFRELFQFIKQQQIDNAAPLPDAQGKHDE